MCVQCSMVRYKEGYLCYAVRSRKGAEDLYSIGFSVVALDDDDRRGNVKC